MAWQDNPVATIRESAKVLVETQYKATTSGQVTTISARTRSVSYLPTRYIGMNYDGAKKLADEQAAKAGNTDVNVERQGDSGQYHVIVVAKTTGTWGAWS